MSDGVGAVATLVAVVILAIELYSAAVAYRDGTLELRQTDFFSHLWSAVSRATRSLWHQLLYVPMKKMQVLKRDSKSECESRKRSLRGLAMKVKASVSKDTLTRSSSSVCLPRIDRPKESRGSLKGSRTVPRKLTSSSRTMSAMLVR
jgi:hypothetical protein